VLKFQAFLFKIFILFSIKSKLKLITMTEYRCKFTCSAKINTIDLNKKYFIGKHEKESVIRNEIVRINWH